MANNMAHASVTEFEGIYDAPDAARYLLAARMAKELYPVNSRNLIRWVRHGLASPELVGVAGRDLILAFEDLVSMRVIAALRSAGVRWRAIYTAEGWLRQATGANRPFATEQLWTEGSDVFTEMHTKLIAASRYGQIAMDLIREFLIPIHGLTFSEMQLATSWEPMDGILLHPLIQFGAPCIKGTRIPARTLAGMVEAGDSAPWLAEAFQLTEGEVHTALAWEQRLAA